MFGSLVVGYLFCAGTGAGACCVLSVLALLVPREETCAVRLPASAVGCSGAGQAFVLTAGDQYRKLFGGGFTASFCMLALGSLMLFLDLGRMSAVPLLVMYPTATYLTLGFWALIVSLAATGGLAAAWGLQSVHVRYRAVRAGEWIALASGGVVAVYTGLLLSSIPAVPFWSTPALPALFSLSALSCGCALVLACAVMTGLLPVFSAVLVRVVRFDVVIIVLEVVAACALLVVALSHPYAVAAQGSATLLEGSLQALFLAGFAGAGIAVPLVLEAAMAAGKVRLPSVALVASACVLVGGVVLRYCIVAAGAHPEIWAVVS